MAKIPVTKTVVRNGQTHIQTYWEEDDKGSSGASSVLAGIGASLPAQHDHRLFPEDEVLKSKWSADESNPFNSTDTEAAIAAGLTVNAARFIASDLPEWKSLGDHIYESGMEEMPRPKGGWKNKDAQLSTDQLQSWASANVPLEEAVQWIDAGFEMPSGATELMQAGVALERAKQWNDHMKKGKKRDGDITKFIHELKSDISLEGAIEYRKALKGNATEAMTPRDLEFYAKDIPANEAARWAKAAEDDVSVSQFVKLNEWNWTPSAVKNIATEFYGPNFSKFDTNTVDFVFDVTNKLGSAKLVNDWFPVVLAANRTFSRDMFNSAVVRQIHDSEEFKSRAHKETGIGISKSENQQLLMMTPESRDVYIGIMNSDHRGDSSGKDVRDALKLANFIGTSDNLGVLKDNGFVFGNPDTDKPYTLAFDDRAYEGFDASSADESSRNKWMKETALRLYSGTVRQQNERDRWTEDSKVDVVAFKDALIANPSASDEQLETLMASSGRS